MSWNLHEMHKECELLIPDYGDIQIVIQIGKVHYSIGKVELNDSSRDGVVKLVLHPYQPVGDAA
jgi:hypothetical protein